nr:hypothetical protein [Tanacetum cinerariifolium]
MELYTKLSERVLNLETTKTAQAKEISSFKRRVKRLEKKKKSRTHGLKRLYKIGLSARLESFAEEQSLDEEDASKQERNIADIDADAKTILVDETVEDQGRFDDQEMFDTDVPNDEEVVVEDIIAATTTDVSIDDITLAQALVEIKTLKPKARGIIMQEPSETPTTTTTMPISSKVQDKGKARRLQAMIDEQDRLAEEKEKAQLIEDENLAWGNVQAMMDADYELAASSKRTCDKLDQGRSKKQKVEDDKEEEDLKRADGNSQMYYTFSKMLKNFDREDLEVLWRLVKDRVVKSKPVDDMDSFLLHTLKTMFEHHVEDTVWRNQQ